MLGHQRPVSSLRKGTRRQSERTLEIVEVRFFEERRVGKTAGAADAAAGELVADVGRAVAVPSSIRAP